MKPERYAELSISGDALTLQEVEQGYHYCADWDFDLMLIGCTGCTCKKET